MATTIKRKPLHEQLLEQAEQIATKGKGSNSRQATLRRAVSTAYYAIFHLLIHAAASSLARGPERKKLRHVLSRAFEHGEMNSTCKSFGSGTLPQAISSNYGGAVSVPADLRDVANAFCELQKARHEADYAVHVRFTRREAIAQINRAIKAFQAWERVSRHPVAKLFLICLLVGKKLQAR